MTHKTFPRLVILSLLLLLMLFITDCNGINRTPTATPTPEATAIPPTPTSAPDEILWVNSQPDTNDTLTTAITEFAAANSLQFKAVPSLDTSGLTSGTRIVVFASVPVNLAGFTSAAPTTQFVVLGSTSVSAQGNISVIQTSPADEAFMAGYLTMIIAEDWRAAGLLTSDGPIGAAYADAFQNGARFVCGKCNPFYAPIVNLPLVASEPTGTDSTTLLTATSSLTENWLSSAFIDPAFVTAEEVTAMNTRAFNWESVALISTAAAPQDSGAQWAALLSTDYVASLKQLLPQLLAGQGGLTMNAQVTLTSINEDIVTPAKQGLFNQVAADLAANKIIPLSVQ